MGKNRGVGRSSDGLLARSRDRSQIIHPISTTPITVLPSCRKPGLASISDQVHVGMQSPCLTKSGTVHSVLRPTELTGPQVGRDSTRLCPGTSTEHLV